MTIDRTNGTCKVVEADPVSRKVVETLKIGYDKHSVHVLSRAKKPPEVPNFEPEHERRVLYDERGFPLFVVARIPRLRRGAGPNLGR